MRTWGVALALFVGSFMVSLHGIGRPLSNSDEAVYGEMAREMAHGAGLMTLSWQGRPVLNRPPLAVWPLALSARLLGATETALRVPLALEASLVVVLVFLLGRRRYGLAAGVCAAVVLATSDRWLCYAGYIESEPLLLVFVVGAFLCWQRGSVLGWGACLGAALLTKQIVGALPLLAPVADLVARRPIDRRRLAIGLGIAAAMFGGWFALEWHRFGRAFVDAYLLRNVLQRSMTAMHAHTTPAYYFGMLWRQEGIAVVLFVLGIAWAAWKRDGLVLVWALGVLLVFSFAASRVDYYLLLAYPAFALAAGRALAEAAPRFAAPAAVAAFALAHVIPRWTSQPPVSDPETGFLAGIAGGIGRAEDPLVLVDQVPYSARFYSQRRTLQIAFDRADYDEATAILPAEIELASDPNVVLARFGRWFAIVPQVHLGKLTGTVYKIGETPRYVLLTNVPRAER